MDEYTQQLEMQLRFAEEEAQERERISYVSGENDVKGIYEQLKR